MKVSELKTALERMDDDDEVVIAVTNPSAGPSASAGIRGVRRGFDWDQGVTFIVPAQPVRAESRDDQLMAAWWRWTVDVYASSKPPLGDGTFRGIGPVLKSGFMRRVVKCLDERTADRNIGRRK